MWEKLRDGIVLTDSPYSCIIFSSRVLQKLRSLVNRKAGICELGGLLLGFIRGNHFDVLAITVPYKNDYASHYLFIRNDERHLNIFQAIKLKINKNLTYIGEWHTHSEDNPRPSSIDLDEWKVIKATRSYPVVFMILGGKKFYITVK